MHNEVWENCPLVSLVRKTINLGVPINLELKNYMVGLNHLKSYLMQARYPYKACSGDVFGTIRLPSQTGPLTLIFPTPKP